MFVSLGCRKIVRRASLTPRLEGIRRRLDLAQSGTLTVPYLSPVPFFSVLPPISPPVSPLRGLGSSPGLEWFPIGPPLGRLGSPQVSFSFPPSYGRGGMVLSTAGYLGVVHAGISTLLIYLPTIPTSYTLLLFSYYLLYYRTYYLLHFLFT